MVVQTAYEEWDMQTLLRRKKDVGSKTLSQVYWKPRDSYFWVGIMAANKFFFSYGSFCIRDGSDIRSGTISGLAMPLSVNNILCYTILCDTRVIHSLRCRWLPQKMCHSEEVSLVLNKNLLQCLDSFHLKQGSDVFHWHLTKNGLFSATSMYNALIQPDIPVDNNNNKKIWKMKISLKMEVFTWYLRRGVILTKDNLVKYNWQRSKSCVFCHQDKTIKHILFRCKFARSIWSTT
jgi:hypothetical protein